MRSRALSLLISPRSSFLDLLPLQSCVFKKNPKKQKREHDTFAYFFISILSFFGKQLTSSSKALVVRGAVMEYLNGAGELLAKDCKFSRPLPGGLLFMDECVCLLVQPCPPGLTLAFLVGSPGPSLRHGPLKPRPINYQLCTSRTTRSVFVWVLEFFFFRGMSKIHEESQLMWYYNITGRLAAFHCGFQSVDTPFCFPVLNPSVHHSLSKNPPSTANTGKVP